MNRLTSKWEALSRKGEKALISFITAGDPDLGTTQKLITALEKGGVDILELGVPFSDPMADGPVIQKASERALLKGTNLQEILELVKKTRLKTQIPILLMGYYNPILSYGLNRYAQDAAAAGVDATLVVDLPPEESWALDRELKKAGLDLIYLLSPTSDAERIHKVARCARGFIYFVSITGVTGARLQAESDVQKKVAEIRKYTKIPVVVGFGISTPEQARQMASTADGIVVGSAFVSFIEKNISHFLEEKIENYARELKSALKD